MHLWLCLWLSCPKYTSFLSLTDASKLLSNVLSTHSFVFFAVHEDEEEEKETNSLSASRTQNNESNNSVTDIDTLCVCWCQVDRGDLLVVHLNGVRRRRVQRCRRQWVVDFSSHSQTTLNCAVFCLLLFVFRETWAVFAGEFVSWFPYQKLYCTWVVLDVSLGWRIPASLKSWTPNLPGDLYKTDALLGDRLSLQGPLIFRL